MKLNKEEIDVIILSSGSTNIPKIQRMLSEYFNGKELQKSIIEPKEVVAYGISIQAKLINGNIDDDKDDNFKELKLVDVSNDNLKRLKINRYYSIIFRNWTCKWKNRFYY